MPFFDDLPAAPDEPTPQRYVAPHWARVPYEVLPTPWPIQEPVIHRSDDAALLLDDVRVYPTGITFSVLLVAHPSGRSDEAPMHESFHGGAAGAAQRVQIGVLQPDGSRETYPMRQAPFREDGEAPKAHLAPAGGGGGSMDVASTGFWAWPIPAEGDLKLYFRWLAEGLQETEVTLDGDELRAAAAACREIWPGAEVPEPSPQDGAILGW